MNRSSSVPVGYTKGVRPLAIVGAVGEVQRAAQGERVLDVPGARAAALGVDVLVVGHEREAVCVGNARDAGLVTALDRIDGSLLGVGAFDAVLVAPPQPGAPQRLRIFVSRAQLQRVEFVMSDGDIIPCVRVIVGGEEVEVQWNPEEFGRTCVPVETADLSGVAPPAPRW